MEKRITELSKFVILMSLVTTTYEIRVGAHKPEPESRSSSWANTMVNGEEHKTEMEFYYHDVANGDSPTAIQVVAAPGSKEPFTGFGFISMADDPLTVGPDPNSKMVGRAQGMYLGASREEVSLVVALAYSFLDGIYNGSSISILGRNSILSPTRELTVVGGTGYFRMARGYAFIRTHSLTPSGNAIVAYNVTLFHSHYV